MLLCDAAQEVGGKLYILGGGWSVTQANVPVQMALAVKLSVPWDQTNEPHQIALSLLDADGEPVMGESGEPIRATGEFELGRPAGLKRGTPLDAPFVASFSGVALEAGSYVWQLEVDGTLMERAPFLAIAR
jgi:hypothetical protein